MKQTARSVHVNHEVVEVMGVFLHADGILYWTPLILDGILTGNFNGRVVTGAQGITQQQTNEDCRFRKPVMS